jgi:hypothetical protein
MQIHLARWLLPVVLLAGLVSSVALAQDAPDPGKLKVAADDFDEASRLFKLKQYEPAAERFESADRLAPNPAALANAIRARKSAKQHARAATLAALAIVRYPDDKAIQDLAQSTIKGSEKALQRVDVACKPACTLVVDGKVAVADAVSKVTVFLDPGSHTLIAGWSSDRSRTMKVEGSKGGAESLSLEAPPMPTPPPSASAAPAASSAARPATSSAEPPPPPPSSGLPPLVFVAGAGATLLLGGITVWSGLDTRSNPGPDAVHEACQGKTRDCPLFQDGLSKERRTNILIASTAIVGVATAVVGAFFTDWSGKSSSESTTTGKRGDGRKVIPTMSVGQGVSVGLFGVF